MSFPRRVKIFKIRTTTGVRFLGLAAGIFMVDSVDDFIRRMVQMDAEMDTVTQAFNASRVAGAEHLVHSSRLAIIANERGCGFADCLAVELICWAAAERQIYRAFEKIGVRQGRNALAVASVGRPEVRVKKTVGKIFDEFGAEWDNSLMDFRQEKSLGLQRIFSITPEETAVAPLQKIVLERVALLALAK
ncbi:KEOPS complex subunit Cgi121 [Candidatus Hadarchaeum sp.]|uniref:KEOPS complex subunit Cgi121 n=1 Tax=Candidatus Hadarchaeum sp. TaxID=2883567 RepID=UPI003D0E852B